MFEAREAMSEVRGSPEEFACGRTSRVECI